MLRTSRILTPAVVLASAALVAVPAADAAPPPAPTGNLLVLLAHDRARAAAGGTVVRAVIARSGAALAGRSVPQIGLITVRPPRGTALVAFANRLRRLPGVVSVHAEHRYAIRAFPNDPALSAPDPDSGVVEWALAKEGFYNAWGISQGRGALVGVIDTGVDGSHPELAGKIAAAVDEQDPSDARGTAVTDEVGHGTHVASLACAATGNGIGMAGAGYDCRLVIEKSDFSDSSIAASIVDATDRGVQALNMSFGPDTPTSAPPPDSEVRALDYAAAHRSGRDQQRAELIASGIARYEIYVRVGGGRPKLIATTSGHGLTFRGRPGMRYVFYAVAIDRAGNREGHPVENTTRITGSAR